MGFDLWRRLWYGAHMTWYALDENDQIVGSCGTAPHVTPDIRHLPNRGVRWASCHDVDPAARDSYENDWRPNRREGIDWA